MNQENRNNQERYQLKEQVLIVAMHEFTHKGIKQVKMDDVAKLLGMSKRTLYELFADKEDLLLEGVVSYKRYCHDQQLIDAQKSRNVLELLLLSFSRKIEEFRHTNFRFYQDVYRYPKVLHYLKTCSEQENKVFRAQMDKGVEEGLFRPDINYDIFILLLNEQFRVLFERDVWDLFSPMDMLRSILFVSLRGVLTQQGLLLFEQFVDADFMIRDEHFFEEAERIINNR